MSLENEAGTTPDDEGSLHNTYADSLGVALEESTDADTTNKVETGTGDKADVSVDTETAEQKASRLRDEQGRFKAGDKPEITPVVDASKPKINRPSSWKKDHWESFDALAASNPALAQYINQRESEFATGVSTYKAEYDRVKPIDDALQPIMPILQQHGRDPAEWIQTMGRVHQTFAFGSAQDKVNATLQLLKDYNVPLLDYITQGGQLPQFNPNAVQQRAPAPQPAQDVRAIVQEQLEMDRNLQAVRSFTEAKDAQGNPKHPHYETVKQDMVGLLQAGLAKDLDSAYDRALRMHDDLWQQVQDEKVQAAAAEKAAQQQKTVERAKRNAVSVTNSTRSANMSAGGDKELRDVYADSLGAAGGRV